MALRRNETSPAGKMFRVPAETAIGRISPDAQATSEISTIAAPPKRTDSIWVRA
jgi:hypothetical protein